MLRENDKKRFAEVLQFLAKRFCKECKDNKLDKEDLMSYWFFLRDEFENIDEFEKVALKVGKVWKFGRMPEPSFFIEKLSPDKINLEIIAQKAWESVMFCLESGVGYTKSAEFDDNLIPLIIENYLGGFSRLGRMDYKELDFKKKEFLKIYENLTKKREVVKKVEVKTLVDNTIDKLKITADYPVLKVENADNLIINKKIDVGLGFKRI
jgi:hypothetical protein